MGAAINTELSWRGSRSSGVSRKTTFDTLIFAANTVNYHWHLNHVSSYNSGPQGGTSETDTGGLGEQGVHWADNRVHQTDCRLPQLIWHVLSVTSECSQWETNQLGTKGWLFRGSCSNWRSNWAELTSTAENRICFKICPKFCCRKNVTENKICLSNQIYKICLSNQIYQICLPNQIYKICLSNQIYGQEIEWNPSIWSNQAFQYGFETQTDALYYCIWWLRKPSGANM